MIVDCAHYQDGHRTGEGLMPPEEAAGRAARGGFVWLGLFEPESRELARVGDIFGLHELAVEDAMNLHYRPKVEDYAGEVRLVNLRTARYDDQTEEVEFGELAIFVAPTFVITERRGSHGRLTEARQRLERRPELLALGSSSALWAVLAEVVGGYPPVVDGLEEDNDQIEATVFSGAVAPTKWICSKRRETTDFYRAVHPLVAVVDTIEHTTASPQLRPYLRALRATFSRTLENHSRPRRGCTLLRAELSFRSAMRAFLMRSGTWFRPRTYCGRDSL